MLLQTLSHSFSVQQKYKAICSSAFRRKKKCTVGLKHIQRLFEINDGFCDYTGVPFSSDLLSANFPSVDRIDSTLGYVPGNLVLCTREANSIKEECFERTEPNIQMRNVEQADRIYNSLVLNISTLQKKYKCNADKIPKLRIFQSLRKYKRHRAEFKDNTVMKTADVKVPITSISTAQQEVLTKLKNNEAQTKNKHIPKDYDVCSKFVRFCDSHSHLDVIISIDEFRQKLKMQFCQFSNQVIVNRCIIVLDDSKPVTSQNVLVIDKQYLNIFNSIKDSGLSVLDCQKYINKLCANTYKEKENVPIETTV